MSRLKKLKIEAITKANKQILREQSEEVKGTSQIQQFLNAKRITDDSGNSLEEDGLAGDSTSEAISKYQSSLGVYPADGVWGPDTMEKMPEEDKELLDSFGSWFERLF
jgi:peptidoglycan hydrolase-like protein with peptidoglycan-binding domain